MHGQVRALTLGNFHHSRACPDDCSTTQLMHGLDNVPKRFGADVDTCSTRRRDVGGSVIPSLSTSHRTSGQKAKSQLARVQSGIVLFFNFTNLFSVQGHRPIVQRPSTIVQTQFQRA